MAEFFYVTVLCVPSSGHAWFAWLAGPFDTKEAAEGFIPAARKLALAADPWARFDGFGVTKITLGEGRVPWGAWFNSQLGIASPN